MVEEYALILVQKLMFYALVPEQKKCAFSESEIFFFKTQTSL